MNATGLLSIGSLSLAGHDVINKNLHVRLKTRGNMALESLRYQRYDLWLYQSDRSGHMTDDEYGLSSSLGK